VAAGTASRGKPGSLETSAGAGDTEYSAGAAGPHPGRIVLLRDEFGVLSAMCCLDDELVLDPVFQRDYRAESAALEGLGESRVAAPLSYVVDATGRIVAVVRRHVVGVLLSDVLARMSRGLDVQTATTVVKDVLTALDALHRRGVAHRSVDPRHVIVEPDGGCVLVDVGLTARVDGADPLVAAAEDLAAVPELFAACVTTGVLPEGGSGGYFAPGELEGVSEELYTVLSAARYAAPERWDRAGAVPVMLAALVGAAADCFDAGWDDRGRERLASAAAQTPPPTRGRFFDFVPMGRGRGGRARPGRGRRAATSAVASAPGTSEGDITLGAGRAWQSAAANASRLTGEWLGETWHTGVGRRAARRGSGQHSKNRKLISRIAIPLLVFLVAFALLRVAFSGSATSGTVRGGGLVASPTAQASASRAVAPVAVPSVSPSSVGATPSVSADPTQTVQPVTYSKAPLPTAVTSVSITSIGYDPRVWGQATVLVDVRASGTGAVAVAVEVDEPGGYFGGGGTSTRTDQFSESGKLEYTVSDSFPVAVFCSRTGPQVVAAVTVTATVPGSADGPMTATAQLSSVRC